MWLNLSEKEKIVKRIRAGIGTTYCPIIHHVADNTFWLRHVVCLTFTICVVYLFESGIAATLVPIRCCGIFARAEWITRVKVAHRGF